MENHVDMTPQAKKIYNRLSCVRWTAQEMWLQISLWARALR